MDISRILNPTNVPPYIPGMNALSFYGAIDNVYVSDTLNNRIQVFNSQGDFLTLVDEFPAEPSTYFWSIGAQYQDGKLYTSDFFNNRVVAFDVNQQASTSISEPSLELGIC